MGSAPFLGGGFGHFYAYAPVKLEYAIDRYAMEVKRQMDVLNRHLAEHRYMVGDTYTIADMAIWPWYGALSKGQLYEAGEFLAGPRVHPCRTLGRRDRAASGSPARAHGQPCDGRPGQPAARTP